MLRETLNVRPTMLTQGEHLRLGEHFPIRQMLEEHFTAKSMLGKHSFH